MRTTARPGVPPLVPGDPQTVGGYTLLGRLGTGGMGTVYLGRAPDGTPVAVKTLPIGKAEDPEARQRFRAEAAYARRVATFCTARVLTDGSDRTHPYIVTEYIDGPPLSQVVERRGALSPEAAAAVGIGVAVALAAIHGAGLVHRDLKPANVLLARSGPRVIDFGIAVEEGRGGDRNGVRISGTAVAGVWGSPPRGAQPGGPTRAGTVMGSPGWIAPERLTGGPATPAADVFGWGCLVAYAATGRHPFGNGPVSEVGRRIIDDPPDVTGLTGRLRATVLSTLDKDPARRPSAVELLHALLPLRAAGDPAKAISDLWEPREFAVTSERPGRPLARAGFAVAWALGGAALAIWAVTGNDPAADAHPEPGRTEFVTVTPTGGERGRVSPADARAPDPFPATDGRSRTPRESSPSQSPKPPSWRPPDRTTPPAQPTPTATPTATASETPHDRPRKRKGRKNRHPRVDIELDLGGGGR